MTAIHRHLLTLTLCQSEITARLATHYLNWQCFWLHNDGNAVIGILPKVRFVLSGGDLGDHYLTVFHRSKGDGQYIAEPPIPCTYRHYQQIITAYHQDHKSTAYAPHHHYHHGLMGYISYDIAAQFISEDIAHKPNTTLAYFGEYDCYLTQHNGQWVLCVSDDFTSTININKIINQINDLKPISTPKPIKLTPIWQKKDYAFAFAQTIAYLKAGDAYQINLTQGFDGQSDGNLIGHLPKLFNLTQAPFCGYVAIDNDEILSISPELFFDFVSDDKGNINLITRPIKGTRPRSDDPILDDKLKNELMSSEKDLAENVMIVDLMRNDLGRYAKFGTVSTPERFAVHSFSNVHHMVSTVRATLNNTPSLTVLFNSLPAGSITGSPKKRACQLIHELESSSRGAYCGTIGYMNFDDSGQWNVLIRTVQAHNIHDDHNNKIQHVQLWAGGGITVLSNVDEEYKECLDKSSQIADILANH